RRGIVHRDVKPANVIIDTIGEPQLLDFGIAKDLNSFAGVARTVPSADPTPAESASSDDSMQAETVITGGNSSAANWDEGIQGPPAFRAPEQADPRRGPVDARSDVYALGATLYVLATGRRPFESATITELLVRVVTEPPVPPIEFADISPDL